MCVTKDSPKDSAPGTWYLPKVPWVLGRLGCTRVETHEYRRVPSHCYYDRLVRSLYGKSKKFTYLSVGQEWSRKSPCLSHSLKRLQCVARKPETSGSKTGEMMDTHSLPERKKKEHRLFLEEKSGLLYDISDCSTKFQFKEKAKFSGHD